MAVGFVAASGYGQLESAPLSRIAYWATTLSMKCYEESSWSNWVNSMADDVLLHNQVVKFSISDEPEPYRPYEKNQTLIDDEISAYEVQAQLSFAEYGSTKVNDLDMFRSSERIDEFMKQHSMKRIARYGETLNARVLSRFLAEASPENQGTNAGMVSHSYNLGTSAVPVDLSNPSDLAGYLAKFQATALETKCFGTGGGWHMVLPSQFQNALYSSQFANKLNLGACSELVCQGINGNPMSGNTSAGLFGFRLWVNLGISVPNAAGALPVIAFHEDAQLFTSAQVVSRVYEAEHFDKKWQELWVSGGKVLYPHKVVIGWITM